MAGRISRSKKQVSGIGGAVEQPGAGAGVDPGAGAGSGGSYGNSGGQNYNPGASGAEEAEPTQTQEPGNWSFPKISLGDIVGDALDQAAAKVARNEGEGAKPKPKGKAAEEELAVQSNDFADGMIALASLGGVVLTNDPRAAMDEREQRIIGPALAKIVRSSDYLSKAAGITNPILLAGGLLLWGARVAGYWFEKHPVKVRPPRPEPGQPGIIRPFPVSAQNGNGGGEAERAARAERVRRYTEQRERDAMIRQAQAGAQAEPGAGEGEGIGPQIPPDWYTQFDGFSPVQ